MTRLRRLLASSIDVVIHVLMGLCFVAIVAGKLLEVIRLRVLPPADRRRLSPVLPPE